MKIVFFLLSTCSLLFTTNLFASEQKIIFNIESITYAQDTGYKGCQELCAYKHSDPDVNSILNNGWRIINSSPKESIAENYRKSAGLNIYYGCTCVGTQYVLQKDDPVPVVKPDIQSKSEELFKKENELLKRENDLLKQEIENLKEKLAQKQKKK